MKYRRADSVLDTRVDGELIAFDVENGVYHHFNATGTAIWDLLETPKSDQDLVSALAGRFGAETETVARDIAPFLRDLAEKRVIVAEDGAAA